MKGLDTRYLEFRKGRGYYYNPPKDALASGLFKGLTRSLGTDKAEAARQADRYNKLLTNWRDRGKDLPRKAGQYNQNSFEALCHKYYESRFFKSLTEGTQKQYKNVLKNLCATEIRRGTRKAIFGELLLIELTVEDCYEAYETIFKTRGQSAAHYAKRLMCRLLTLATTVWVMSSGITKNVAEKMQVEQPVARETVWQDTETAISKFYDKGVELGYPSLARIALACYELMQRPKDMRLLRKESYRVTDDGPELWFTQSKRQQTLWIVVSEQLAQEIEASIKENPDAEVIFPCEATGRAWTRHHFARKVRAIMNAAGLPAEWRISDLRRTAATEAGDAGCTEDEIMSLGGWRSRQIVSTYVKKTKTAAANAQEKRRSFRNNGKAEA